MKVSKKIERLESALGSIDKARRELGLIQPARYGSDYAEAVVMYGKLTEVRDWLKRQSEKAWKEL